MKRLLGLSFLSAVFILSGRPTRADGLSLGVGAGVVKTENISETFYITGNLRFPLFPYVVLEPEVGYWKKDYNVLGATASAEDLSFGGNALLVIPAHPLSIWGGAGLGAHQLKGSFNAPGLGSISSSETRLGIHLLVGLDVSIAPRVKLFGAARYDIIHEDPSTDNIHETKFYGGLRLSL
jgi:hypothetical protein